VSFLKQPFLAQNHVSKSDSTIFLHGDEVERETPCPFSPATAFHEFREGLIRPTAEAGEPLFSVAEELEFIHTKSSNKIKFDGQFTARALACLCERGQSVSITLRSTKPSKNFVADSDNPIELIKTQFSASDSYTEPVKNWLSIDDHCKAMGNLIFPRTDHPHGLVVICGSTNSAKSLIARGLIHNLLAKKCEERAKEREGKSELSRRPHLVTFEDPIEDFLFKPTFKDGQRIYATELAWKAGVDYTPREKGKDVRDLKQGFADALRQTPAVYFIGEARDVGDWKQILEFAGTGHLVVTTAHAGSLLEMMMKIINACDAKTAAERRHYADKILAVVHMRNFGECEGSGLLVPSVWRNREKGLAALTASGFSSIVPVESVDVSDPKKLGGDESCFGNHAMLRYVWSFRPNPNILDILANLARKEDL